MIFLLRARPARPWRRLPLLAALASIASLASTTALFPVAALGASPPTPVAAAITVEVDARRAAQGLFHSHLVLPAAPGPLVLTYPKWIPGEHSPTGPIQQLVGLRFTAAGTELAWKRDPVEMFDFHLEVPAGATSIEADFDYLSPPETFGGGYGESPNATAHLFVLLWNQQVLVPRGMASDAVTFRPAVVLPSGWGFDSALQEPARAGDRIEFAALSLTALVDSPLLAGEHLRTYPVVGGTGGSHADAPVRLTVAADDAADLEVPAARLAELARVVAEAQALFGARHYRRYVWLVALTSAMDPNGLEHPESSDNRLPPQVFTGAQAGLAELRILPHEYVHSWNGKFRRPGGLATGDYERPMVGELLWIYEGLTRYLGDVVLSTRAGIRPPEATREYLAWMSSQLEDARPGRRWRPLVDTATAVQLGVDAPGAGTAIRRPLDYYEEAALVWLEVDMTLRERSGGKRSLDDFCRRFFGSSAAVGGATGAPGVLPYTLDDVLAALGELAPFDWRNFFAERLQQVRAQAPLAGLAAAGWQLTYGTEPNLFMAAREEVREVVDWSFSLGIKTNVDGDLLEIVQDSPAWAAGLAPGGKLVGVGGVKFTPEALRQGLEQSASAGKALVLLVERRSELRTVEVEVPRGAQHPHLSRIASQPDGLSAIFAARTRP
jgi:predicted metalloprotease with PDZ domain